MKKNIKHYTNIDQFFLITFLLIIEGIFESIYVIIENNYFRNPSQSWIYLHQIDPSVREVSNLIFIHLRSLSIGFFSHLQESHSFCWFPISTNLLFFSFSFVADWLKKQCKIIFSKLCFNCILCLFKLYLNITLKNNFHECRFYSK